jgi:hypothetical protein
MLCGLLAKNYYNIKKHKGPKKEVFFPILFSKMTNHFEKNLMSEKM